VTTGRATSPRYAQAQQRRKEQRKEKDVVVGETGGENDRAPTQN
jgi:hypothetical protein